ncbi:hypothetical protein [Prochlorothrix hollandica]|uniref:hypothetical protein n=1 Tax=Prochlorothrix hollandica TaxID=1223 RepID=UPI000376971A|nr:hypothetical protein [Prochlorothrix hollandica]
MESLEKLCDIYQKVTETLDNEDQFHNGIQLHQSGNLFNILKIILLEDNGNSPQEKTRLICENIEVNVRTSISEELKLCRSIVSSSISEKCRREAGNVEWIILGACSLAGSYFCVKYIKNNESERQFGVVDKAQLSPRQEVPEQPRKLFTLLLVLPYKTSNLSKGMLPINDLKNLIDSSSFFYCSSQDVSDIESSLDQLPEGDDVEQNEYGEVYVRVQLYNVPDLSNVSSRYELKSSLDVYPSTASSIKKCFRLSNRSGLDKFIRI